MPATGQVIGAAVASVWLGMMLAVSCLETPLKFRAPGITLPLGVGIGRLVFRALNTVEVVLAVALITALLTITAAPRDGRCSSSLRHCWPPRPFCCGRAWTDEPSRSSPVTRHPLAPPPDLHRPGMPRGRDADRARSPPGHHLVNPTGRKVPAAAQHQGK